MGNDLFWNLLLNIGLLTLAASMLTNIRLVRVMLLTNRDSIWSQMFLTILFGAMCIFSTYIGQPVDGVIVNTRSMSVLAAGIVGGPWVGMGAALIGSLHRYFYGGFTAVACSLSTLAAGVIGAVLSPLFDSGKLNKRFIIFVTTGTELLHMGIILAVCRPFAEALSLVQTIAVPVVVVNSAGMLIFLATFDNVFKDRDYETSLKLREAFDISEQSLPHLRSGFSDRDNLFKTIDIILSRSSCEGAMITDRHEILAQGERTHRLHLYEIRKMPQAAVEAIEKNCLAEQEDVRPEGGTMKRYRVMAAPLRMHGKPAGALVFYHKKQWPVSQASTSFLEGLAMLFSTQLELSELEYQKKLRRKAEFKALQSQINPHFLFNALNTISYITREDPEKARTLINTLASYFRQSLETDRDLLKLSTEMEQVANYLTLEKARFEDNLQVTVDIPPEADVVVPSLTLQPLVENAIKYGADSHGRRIVHVQAERVEGGVSVCISDHGHGFSETALRELRQEKNVQHVGLSNVHKRLKSLFGEQSGIRVDSSPEGSKVSFFIPDSEKINEEGVGLHEDRHH